MSIGENEKLYNDLTGFRQKLIDHYWSRQITRKDSAFIAWMDSRLIVLSNQAYALNHPKEANQCQK